MIKRSTAPSTHPSVEVLALFFSSDLRVFDRWKIRRHLRKCEHCERQLAVIRAANIELKRQARTETLTGFEAIADWSRLEREMEGNIIVGLAAARCVDKGPNHRGLFIKLSLAFGLLTLFILGWVTRVPYEQTSRIFGAMRSAFPGSHPVEYQSSFLKTRPDGIVVGSQDGSLTILHPSNAVVSLSGTSSVEARYVDDETGQVTITDVYGQ